MIETKIPKDIRQYKTKLIGPFDLRQIICISICIVADILVYACIYKPLSLNIKWLVYAIVGVDMPVMAFTFEPRGMKMEQYIKHILIKAFLAPTNRKARNIILTESETEPTPKSKLKKKQKKDPSLKPYK